MNETINKVIQWANERNLILGSDPKSQALKLMSEVGELADNINKRADCRDDIGDCLVVLTIIAEQKGYTIQECLDIAYNDIKDRKGVMFNGCFVKETDARYESVKAQIESKKEIEIMGFAGYQIENNAIDEIYIKDEPLRQREPIEFGGCGRAL